MSRLNPFIQRKPFFKRLFCLHFWENTHIPDDLVFATGKFWYLCTRCGKEKRFRNDPVNPVGLL